MKVETLTSKTLKAAGWLSMASAFLALPMVYLSFKMEGRTDPAALAVQTTIQIFGTFIFIAIVLYLKRLLNFICNFQNTDRNIEQLIMASALTGVLSVAALYVPSYRETLGSVVIVILVLQGIVQVQFGYRLLELPNDLGGMRKPFCYANMLTGILLASIVLIPLGILVSAISDLMLGTIFLNMSGSLNSET